MENIKQLLELNIEIEGLLRVYECRKSDTVESLLLAKSKKFLEILNLTLSDKISKEYAPEPTQSISTSSEEESKTKEVTYPPAPEVTPQMTGSHEDLNAIAFSESKVIPEEIETVLEMDVEAQTLQTNPEDGDQSYSKSDAVMSHRDTDASILMTTKNEMTPSQTQPSEPDHVMRLDEMIHRQSSRDLKKAFSLNDRFRYIRELFDNNAGYFDETIKNLDMLSNLDEVYDYLLGDLGLDHEDDTVKDFLSIVFNHFNA